MPTIIGEVGGEPCIIVGALTFMPHMTVVKDGSAGFRFVGTLMEVFRIISQRLGRCMRLVKVPDNQGGVRAANGSWSGSIGMVHRGEVDASTLLMTTWERFQDVDASDFLYMEEHTAGYTRPVLESDIAGFIKPFSPSVWSMVLVTVMAVLTAICLLRLARERLQWVRMSSSLGPVGPQVTKTVGVGTIAEESILWTVCAFLAQAVPLRSPEGVVRQVTGLWLLLALILVTVYRSNLKAMLILPKVTLPFDNLEELVQTDLPVWVATGSILHDAAMTAAGNTSLGRLNPMFNSVSAPTNVSWGVSDFLRGKHVLAAPRSALQQIIHASFSQTGHCKTYLMSESFITTSMGSLMFTKGSSLKAKVDPIIRQLREYGILDYLYRQGVSNSSECLRPISAALPDSSRALDLGDFYGVFFVYAGGMALASVAFLVELLLLLLLLEASQGPPGRTGSTFGRGLSRGASSSSTPLPPSRARLPLNPQTKIRHLTRLPDDNQDTETLLEPRQFDGDKTLFL